MGYSPWGRKQLDTTEQLMISLFSIDKIAQIQSIQSNATKRTCLCNWHPERPLVPSGQPPSPSCDPGPYPPS